MRVLNKIKSFLQAPAQVKQLQADLALSQKHTIEFRERYQEERERQSDPRKVMEKIFNKGIKWFDAGELTRADQKKYFDEAQMILNSTTFNNVVNFLIATQVQEQIKQYNPDSNINPIRDLQMVLNGFELLREELGSIPDPNGSKPNKDFDKFAVT